jgi:predicted DNA-binding transcriptional regulator AlpA
MSHRDSPASAPSRVGNSARKLPAGITPRGLSRLAAAEYCGLAPSTFDARVNDGLLPAPVFSGRSRVWDRLALDQALNLLSGFDDKSSNAAENAALRVIRHGGGKRALRR